MHDLNQLLLSIGCLGGAIEDSTARTSIAEQQLEHGMQLHYQLPTLYRSVGSCSVLLAYRYRYVRTGSGMQAVV